MATCFSTSPVLGFGRGVGAGGSGFMSARSFRCGGRGFVCIPIGNSAFERSQTGAAAIDRVASTLDASTMHQVSHSLALRR
jgi:hypothetical protein